MQKINDMKWNEMAMVGRGEGPLEIQQSGGLKGDGLQRLEASSHGASDPLIKALFRCVSLAFGAVGLGQTVPGDR